jgi:hypothetical protein
MTKLYAAGYALASIGLLTYLYGSASCYGASEPYCYYTSRLGIRTDTFGMEMNTVAIVLLVVGFSITFASALLKRQRKGKNQPRLNRENSEAVQPSS